MMIAKATGVHSKKIDNTVVILEKNKQYIRKLNPTASFLWEKLHKPTNVKDLASELAREFGITTDTAQRDVADWVQEYLREGFLQKIKS